MSSRVILEGRESSHAPFLALLALLVGTWDLLADLPGGLAGHVARACLTQVERVLFLTALTFATTQFQAWSAVPELVDIGFDECFALKPFLSLTFLVSLPLSLS